MSLLIRPLRIFFHITHRCNLSCIHCAIPKSENDPQEMNYDGICQVIDQIVEFGFKLLTISGGEPFLRKDCLSILNYAVGKGLYVNMLTNGTLLSQVDLNRIKKLGVVLSIPIYGGTNFTHDAITRIPGSFSLVKKSIRKLKQKKIEFNITTVVMQKNIDELSLIRTWTRRRNIALLRVDPFIMPKINKDFSTVRHRISRKRMKNFIRDNFISGFFPKKSMADLLNEFVCEAAKNNCVILPNGDFLPCLWVSVKNSNLKNKSLLEIWQDNYLFLLLRELKKKDLSVCNKCSLLCFCNPCPALSFLEKGNVRLPSETCCQHAQILHEVCA